MPIILSREAYGTWLNTEVQGKDAKALLLDAQIDSQLEFFRVGRAVNNSRYDGTDTKQPLINSL
jgi:putative SOS response-associated peptidase YedK